MLISLQIFASAASCPQTGSLAKVNIYSVPVELVEVN